MPPVNFSTCMIGGSIDFAYSKTVVASGSWTLSALSSWASAGGGSMAMIDYRLVRTCVCGYNKRSMQKYCCIFIFRAACYAYAKCGGDAADYRWDGGPLFASIYNVALEFGGWRWTGLPFVLLGVLVTGRWVGLG